MKLKIVLFLASAVIGYTLYDEFDAGELKGKNVVITGASAGIGEQLAYQYARLGARLLMTSRTEADLKRVAEQCRKFGSKDGVYLYQVADMAVPESAKELIQTANQLLGGIDYLVLNHVKMLPLLSWKSTSRNITVLEDVLNVNFLAYVRLASEALEALKTSKGSVVVVSSMAGRVPMPYFLPYSTAKFALDGFFSGLRLELAMQNADVSLTVCYIGLTNTQRAMEILQEFGADRVVHTLSPVSPDDVAFAILRGAALRQRAVYYPYTYVRPAIIAYHFIPTVMDHIMAVLYAKNDDI